MEGGMIRREVTTLNVFAKRLTCPARKLIPNAVEDGHKTVVGGHPRVRWREMYLLYNQRAWDGDGVYPFTISV